MAHFILHLAANIKWAGTIPQVNIVAQFILHLAENIKWASTIPQVNIVAHFILHLAANGSAQYRRRPADSDTIWKYCSPGSTPTPSYPDHISRANIDTET